ncbi:MAG: aldo/keto reductase [bacterium]|nr:aldo/keto reductase [bacterium]
MVVQLGKTGLKVNPVGFGGIPIQRLSAAESDAVVQKALDMGINFFDTSRIYTDSEEKLGRIFSRGWRDKIIIASKTFSRTAQQATEDLETGLKQLKTDYIDLYQLHNIGNDGDLEKVLGPGGALEALQKAKQEGKIRHIGITGHKPPMLLKALDAFDFETLQVPLNYIEQACLETLVPKAREKGMGIIAMKPVAGGAFKNVPLGLRFILTHGADVVIPGMDNPQQVVENLSILPPAGRDTGIQAPDKNELALLEKEKEVLGDHFCRRCEYCMPCPQGLNISFLHSLSAYYFRYDLKDWAVGRINSLPKSFKDCNQCGQCVDKCPYDLDIPGIFKENREKIFGR